MTSPETQLKARNARFRIRYRHAGGRWPFWETHCRQCQRTWMSSSHRIAIGWTDIHARSFTCVDRRR